MKEKRPIPIKKRHPGTLAFLVELSNIPIEEDRWRINAVLKTIFLSISQGLCPPAAAMITDVPALKEPTFHKKEFIK